MKALALSATLLSFVAVSHAASCKSGYFYCGDEFRNNGYTENELEDNARSQLGEGKDVRKNYLYKCQPFNSYKYAQYCANGCVYRATDQHSYCVLVPQSGSTMQIQ
ncbi:MAG: hypothetical protein Q9228_002863 [Teloschistes exilis]